MSPESERLEKEKASLLFVDDEKNILSSLKRLFRSEGYNIFLANGGAEGLEILASESIDLVISDMRMPEMNGAEFLEQVANRWPKVTRILLTGYSEIASTIDAVNKGNIYKYISKPWEDNDIKLTVRHALEVQEIEKERDRLLVLTKQQNEELKEFNTNLEGMVKSRTAELDQTMGMLESAYETMKDSYSATIRVFSNLIEMREGSLLGHSRRIAKQAHDVAISMGMSQELAKQISFAGMLRDIGKIGFTDKMINIPLSSMSPEDRAQYKKHPIIGSGVLMALEPLQTAAKLIRGYCERYDGLGYPDRLPGEDIPLGSKILAVVSDYDALQVGALIEDRLTPSKARDYIIAESGKRYDPAVVDEFLKILGEITQDQEKKEDIKMVPASDLEVNTVLARDLMTSDGVLLLSEGHTLGEHMVKQIKSLEQSLNEVLQIYIKT